MSIKRYHLAAPDAVQKMAGMVLMADGGWVRHQDHVAEVKRLRACVPNPDDLRLLCDFALGGPHTPWPVVRAAQIRVRATLEEA